MSIKQIISTQALIAALRRSVKKNDRHVRVLVGVTLYAVHRCGVATCKAFFWHPTTRSPGGSRKYQHYCSVAHQREAERQQNADRQARFRTRRAYAERLWKNPDSNKRGEP